VFLILLKSEGQREKKIAEKSESPILEHEIFFTEVHENFTTYFLTTCFFYEESIRVSTYFLMLNKK